MYVASLLSLLLAAAAPTTKPATAPAVASPPTPALPVDKVVARMQEGYDRAADYRARFTQKYTYAATGRERTSTGEIMVKKPGRMRWNYETPEKSLWLANNSTLWMYEPEAKQAFKQDLKTSQLPAAVAFLTGKGKLTDEFDVAIAKELPYGNQDDYRLSLKPKKAQSSYRSIYFVVDPRTFLVRQSVLINAQGDINAITFSDMALNTKMGEDVFRWSPPAGTRVIDGATASPASKPASTGQKPAPKAAQTPPQKLPQPASPSAPRVHDGLRPAAAGPAKAAPAKPPTTPVGKPAGSALPGIVAPPR